jgi:ketosteroid isomerase-like protein
MSSSNAELARGLYEAWNRGDLDAMLAHADPQVEWRPHLAEVSGKAVRGHDEVVALFADLMESWETFQVEVEELFEAGDQIVTFVHVRVRGRGSGVEVNTKPAHHIVFRDGVVVRLTTYLDRAEALAAAGIQATQR